MNKKIRTIIISALALLATTSCSDDNKEYPADTYFTGTFNPVQVVSASGTKEPGGAGAAAFNVTFDAAGDWTISAHDLFNPSQTANWVKFFTNSGKEGSHLIGVYADANTSPEERAATVEVNCKGTSISFTLIQQATAPVVNPNLSIINPAKTVTKIDYSGTHIRNFTYSSGGILTGIEDIFSSGDFNTTITSDARMTPAGMAVNKVVVTSNRMPNTTFGVVNGRIAVAYKGNDATLGNICIPHYYGYNASNNLTNVSSIETTLDLGWTNGNLTSFKIDRENHSNPIKYTQTVTYGNELNDANIDLVWFLNLTNPGFIDGVAPAMNLMGIRSQNLPASVSEANIFPDIITYTYSDGVTDANGNTVPGLTMTSNIGDVGGDVVKVYYAN
jgi:hypothetical protein